VAAIGIAIGVAGGAGLAAVELSIFLNGLAIDRTFALGACTRLLRHIQPLLLMI
jgi:hypothetical protein